MSDRFLDVPGAPSTVPTSIDGSLTAVYGNLRLWIGAGLLVLGGLLLADAVMPSRDVPGLVVQWWPFGLVLLGAGGLIRIAWRRPAMLFPLALVVVGSVVLLRRNEVIPSSVDKYVVPVLTCAAGAAMLLQFWRSRRDTGSAPVIGRITAVAQTRKVPWPHKDKSLAQVVAVGSGCVVAVSKPDGLTTARLEITGVLSGVEVLVPAGWRVEEDPQCILGRYLDLKSAETDAGLPLLQIKSLVIASRMRVARS